MTPPLIGCPYCEVTRYATVYSRAGTSVRSGTTTVEPSTRVGPASHRLQTPADDVFRGYARELGLDLAAWDAAHASPATLDQPPTFVVDGTRLQPKTVGDIRIALDTALANQGGGA
ncbi:MAG: hypothetical protein ABS81_22735 [Pseudonocardia sp. SCN 72-86]|nr:MAG: hypothetical protein ABS81_22735 [Pseudonocardia sp. SCN 72-86]